MIRDVLTLSRLQDMPADEAAALWTVRLAEGELPHERDLFDQWLELAPENQAAWARVQRGWNMFDGAEDDELLEAIRRHARDASPAITERRSRFAAAAALLLAVATGSIVADRAGLFGNNAGGTGSSASPIAEASLEFASGRELPKTFALPDGSRMTLDAETRAIASFNGGQRSVQVLSGRAFFAVQHDASRPFVVTARNLEVTDIGTRFDVHLRASDVRVLLVEGQVSVKTGEAAAKPIVMSPGQQLIAPAGGTPSVSPTSNGDGLDWQSGYARFQNETLADATAALNRYPGGRLVVRDPRVAGLRISGNFKVGNPERFGHTLEQIYPVRLVRRNANDLEIVPAG